MHLFLTARLERVTSWPWKGDGGLPDASQGKVTGDLSPSYAHKGEREALDLTPWRNLLRELAP